MKRLLYFIKEHDVLVLSLVIPFLIVNMLSFNGDDIIIQPENIMNILSFNNVINKNGLSTYVSVITVLTLIIALLQWHNNNKFQRIADVNGLFEELRYNLNIVSNIFCQIDESKFYFNLNKKLESINTIIYPNPSDSDKNKRELSQMIIITKLHTDLRFMKLRNDFITSAISSKSYYNLHKSRIFMNLSHLNYSIMRHNMNVDYHNNGLIPVTQLQSEYILWLHFRLNFMLIDLIKNVSEYDFIDKDYVRKIKKYFKSTASNSG
jgi:hypothetical protein